MSRRSRGKKIRKRKIQELQDRINDPFTPEHVKKRLKSDLKFLRRAGKPEPRRTHPHGTEESVLMEIAGREVRKKRRR